MLEDFACPNCGSASVVYTDAASEGTMATWYVATSARS